MLDLCDLSLEGVERLCQADNDLEVGFTVFLSWERRARQIMTWKLVSLYSCPGKEGPGR